MSGHDFLAILSPWINVQSIINVSFGISAYELTIYDQPCAKVILGHPRSYEATDLG